MLAHAIVSLSARDSRYFKQREPSATVTGQLSEQQKHRVSTRSLISWLKVIAAFALTRVCGVVRCQISLAPNIPTLTQVMPKLQIKNYIITNNMEHFFSPTVWSVSKPQTFLSSHLSQGENRAGDEERQQTKETSDLSERAHVCSLTLRRNTSASVSPAIRQWTSKLCWIKMERWHLQRFLSISVATLYCPVFTRRRPWFNYYITSTTIHTHTHTQSPIETAKLKNEMWLWRDLEEDDRKGVVQGKGSKCHPLCLFCHRTSSEQSDFIFPGNTR